MRMINPLRLLVAFTVFFGCMSSIARADEPTSQSQPVEAKAAITKWRVNASSPDQKRMWENLEFEHAPSFSTLKFTGEIATVEKQIEGKFLVIGFWAASQPASVKAMDDLSTAADGLGSDVRVISVQTRVSADQVKKTADEKKWPFLFAADPDGEMGSKLKPGVKFPVFYLVDPAGYIRVAGANPEALPQILQTIRAEPPLPAYPEHATVINLNDMQGKPGPSLERFDWVTPRPNMEKKIVLLYLMDTNAEACFKQFPKLDDKMNAHPGEVVSICVSHQLPAMVHSFVSSVKIDSAFASDPRRTFEDYLNHHGPNYLLVLSSDGVVRWQGTGGALSDNIFKKILEADPININKRFKAIRAAEKQAEERK